MSDSQEKIRIINGPPAVVAKRDYLPREGEPGEVPEQHFGFTFFTNKPVKHLTDQIEELKGKIGTVVTALAGSFTDHAELDEITIGLAVSVEGDIGIASAGAEASIELKFKIKQ